MVVTILRPNSTEVSTWLDASHSYIDEVIEEPDAGDDEYCSANSDDNNEVFTVGFPNTIDDVDEVTNIIIWTQAQTNAGDPEIWIQLVWTEAEQQCDLPLEFGWTSNSFDGSWNQEELDALLLHYRANTPDKGNTLFIETAYAVITYTAVSAGWGHKFLGIPAANIGKINGIPIANIGKVKGVAI